MMHIEEGGGWYYYMNFELDLFRIFVPIEIVRKIWNRREPNNPISDDQLRDFMSRFSKINYLEYIASRVSPSKSSWAKYADLRVTVDPVPKNTAIYKAALADRFEAERFPSHPRFVPSLYCEFGPAKPEDFEFAQNELETPRPNFH